VLTGTLIAHWHHCRGRGAMTWFPVHCTSINNTNSLISGDNKGAASQMFERHARGRYAPHRCRLFDIKCRLDQATTNMQTARGAFSKNTGTLAV
jgi:Neutral/alkaline non-lysosomal ceramidase, N-terminal